MKTRHGALLLSMLLLFGVCAFRLWQNSGSAPVDPFLAALTLGFGVVAVVGIVLAILGMVLSKDRR